MPQQKKNSKKPRDLARERRPEDKDDIDPDIPILDGRLRLNGDVIQLEVWCYWCRRIHYHGAGEPHDPAHYIGEVTHRGAHCIRYDGPYMGRRGYQIRVTATEKPASWPEKFPRPWRKRERDAFEEIDAPEEPIDPSDRYDPWGNRRW